MISGAHIVIFSKDAEADRAFLRDTIGLSGVDVGGGWLIFGLPPTEVAVHPSDSGGKHEMFLMCDDIEAFINDMEAKKVACSAIHKEAWGLLTNIGMPGGGTLGVYQPLHARPE